MDSKKEDSKEKRYNNIYNRAMDNLPVTVEEKRFCEEHNFNMLIDTFVKFSNESVKNKAIVKKMFR